MTIALFAGTFDPLTRAHEAVIRDAAGLFDELVVGVAASAHKSCLLPWETRVALCESVLQPLANVSVQGFNGLLTDFAQTQGATVLVRGLRDAQDMAYESGLAMMYRELYPTLTCVYLMVEPALRPLSATNVRDVARLGGDVHAWVSPAVVAALQARKRQELK